MATRPAVFTQHITREKLARFLPNQESVKLLENLFRDVAGTLPDASYANAEAINEAQNTADAARISADEALVEVEQAQLESDAARLLANSAASVAQAAFNAADQVEYLLGQVSELRDLLSALARRVDDLEHHP